MHIELRSLTKWFGKTPALAEVSVEFAPGQIVAVLGPNGAGKTTLLRCLAAIAAPDEGEIRYDGEPFLRDRLDQRRRLFFLPDFPIVYSQMTVLRYIGLVLKLYEADRPGVEDRVVELLHEFDLLPYIDAWFETLSRGQAYKAALAALIAADPELWMIDEPFASGMDPHGLDVFRKAARDAAAQGRTVLFTTQILELAEAFADRVCVLAHGRMQVCEEVAALKARSTNGDGGALSELFRQLRGATG